MVILCSDDQRMYNYGRQLNSAAIRTRIGEEEKVKGKMHQFAGPVFSMTLEHATRRIIELYDNKT